MYLRGLCSFVEPVETCNGVDTFAKYPQSFLTTNVAASKAVTRCYHIGYALEAGLLYLYAIWLLYCE